MESKESMAQDFTKGSILRAMLVLSGPIILAQLLQSAYQIIDTFWVGRLGTNAVAAVSMTFPVLFLVMSISVGLSIGGSVIVAMAWGNKNRREAEHVATQTVVSMFLVSIAVAAIGYLITPWAMQALGATSDVLPLATNYLQWMFIGVPFGFGYFAYQSVARSIGEVKIPVYIILGTVLLNLLLDPLFIYGLGPIPAYGVAGAAVASVITQALSFLAGLTLLLLGTHGIRLHWKDTVWDQKIQKRLLSIGAPASLGHAARAGSFLFMVAIVTTLGTTVLAAYGIGLRLYSFIIIPAIGASTAASTLIGQNLGANKQARAQKTATLALKLSFWGLVIIGIFMFVFAKPLVTAFIPGEHAVIAMGTTFLRIMSLSLGFMGVYMVVTGVFRGGGHTTKALIGTLITLYAIQLPAAYILSRPGMLGELGIWIAIPLSNVLGAAILYAWYRRRTWLVPTKDAVTS